MQKNRSSRHLEEDLEVLRIRLEEAEETLRAITNNEVDALVVNGPQGQQVFTLEGAEQPYRTLMETMSEGALTMSIDGMILYCNQRFAEMVGKPLNKIIGLSLQEIMPSEDWRTLMVLLDACVKKVCRGEFHFITNEAREMPVYVSANFLRLQNVEGFCIVATDLTEQHLLEQKIHQSQKMEAIGTLAGGIAHDFNNILGAIIGFAELVEDDLPPGSPSTINIQRVLKAAYRGRDLVQQILAFSRKTELDIKPISLSPLVEETVQFLRASLPTTIEIKLSMMTLRDTILASPAEFQQILMNLSVNASAAMKEAGGILGIDITNVDFKPDPHVLNSDIEPGEYVQVAITDTGSGMPPNVMDRIFEPFFTTKEVGDGTGMGLPVVYGIVKNLHGAITVESQPGAGSTFRVFLPIAKTDEEQETSRIQLTPKGSERILFVDDEKLISEWGQAALERLGYSVTALTDSTEAFKTFSSDPSGFDLVIADQTMPKLTGLRLARKIQTIRSNIPIILCTGYNDRVSQEKAKAAGIKEFLMKPLGIQVLAGAIRRALDATDSED
jgi:PAS domain S-box-containing protein